MAKTKTALILFPDSNHPFIPVPSSIYVAEDVFVIIDNNIDAR